LENDIKLILREIDSKIKSVNVVHIDEQQGAGIDFKDEISAKNFVDQLEKKYKIYSIDEPKMFSSNPREPYKTSTLQQDAINKLS
jgi:DNA topoisomerase-1